jgi:hypothetical protein
LLKRAISAGWGCIPVNQQACATAAVICRQDTEILFSTGKEKFGNVV